jgi:hypothetical protein
MSTLGENVNPIPQGKYVPASRFAPIKQQLGNRLPMQIQLIAAVTQVLT